MKNHVQFILAATALFSSLTLTCLAHPNHQDKHKESSPVKPVGIVREVPDSEAASHVGETVKVIGRVAAVYTSRKDDSFLNLGGVYPNQNFTGYVFAGSDISLDATFIKSLMGKEIGIVGEVQLYHEKPAIVITKAEQVSVRK